VPATHSPSSYDSQKGVLLPHLKEKKAGNTNKTVRFEGNFAIATRHFSEPPTCPDSPPSTPNQPEAGNGGDLLLTEIARQTLPDEDLASELKKKEVSPMLTFNGDPETANSSLVFLEPKQLQKSRPPPLEQGFQHAKRQLMAAPELSDQDEVSNEDSDEGINMNSPGQVAETTGILLENSPMVSSQKEGRKRKGLRKPPSLKLYPVQKESPKAKGKHDHRQLVLFGLEIMNDLLAEREKASNQIDRRTDSWIRRKEEGTLTEKDYEADFGRRQARFVREEMLESRRFIHKGYVHRSSKEKLQRDHDASEERLLILDGIGNLNYVSESNSGSAVTLCNLHSIVECHALEDYDGEGHFPFMVVYVDKSGRMDGRAEEKKNRNTLMIDTSVDSDRKELVLASRTPEERIRWMCQLTSATPARLKPKNETLWKVQNTLFNASRKIVSGNRRRYMDGKYNLDLTYITPRVIAMAFPGYDSIGEFSLAVRNDLRIVKQFLDEKHTGRYKVYNLCVEKNYSASKFDGRMEWLPCNDHQPPSLRQMMRFCYSVQKWLLMHPDNVVAIHCKGGKGRTGLMVCSYLNFSGFLSSPEEALSFFQEKRTLNPEGPLQGVSGASQKRYLELFSDALTSRIVQKTFRILQVVVHTVPRLDGVNNFTPVVVVRAAGDVTYEFVASTGGISCLGMKQRAKFQSGSTVNMCLSPSSSERDPLVREDFRVELYHNVCKGTTAEQAIFFLCLHTGMPGNSPLRFFRSSLDVGVAFKKNSQQLLDDDAYIEIFYEEVDPASTMPLLHRHKSLRTWSLLTGSSASAPSSSAPSITSQASLTSINNGITRAHHEAERAAAAAAGASAASSAAAAVPSESPRRGMRRRSFLQRLLYSSEPATPSFGSTKRYIVFNEDVEMAFSAKCVHELNPRLVEAGETVIKAGTKVNGLILVGAGSLRSEYLCNEKRVILEPMIGFNEVIGEIAFLLPNLRVQVDYVANQDSMVYTLDKEHVRRGKQKIQGLFHFLAIVCSSKLWSSISHPTSLSLLRTNFNTSMSSLDRFSSGGSFQTGGSLRSIPRKSDEAVPSRTGQWRAQLMTSEEEAQAQDEAQSESYMMRVPETSDTFQNLPSHEVLLFSWDCKAEGRLRGSGVVKVTQSYFVFEAKTCFGRSGLVRLDMLNIFSSIENSAESVLVVSFSFQTPGKHLGTDKDIALLTFNTQDEYQGCLRVLLRLKEFFGEPLVFNSPLPAKPGEVGAMQSFPELFGELSEVREVETVRRGRIVVKRRDRSFERLCCVMEGSAVEIVHGQVTRRAEVGDLLFLIDFLQHFTANQASTYASNDCKQLVLALVPFEKVRARLDSDADFSSRFYEYSARVLALELYRYGPETPVKNLKLFHFLRGNSTTFDSDAV